MFRLEIAQPIGGLVPFQPKEEEVARVIVVVVTGVEIVALDSEREEGTEELVARG